MHLLGPPVGWLGFCDFSISPTRISKALTTLVSLRAEASIHAHLNSSAIFLPSSLVTWCMSGWRSLLFPTSVNGTQSAPYNKVSRNSKREIKKGRTRWFRILSRITRTISNDCLDATEYTIM